MRSSQPDAAAGRRGGNLRTYEAACSWDGDGWAAATVVPDLEVRVRCRYFHQVYDRLSEAVAVATGEPMGSFTVVIEAIAGSPEIDRITQVRALREAAAAAGREAEVATAALIGPLRCAGFGHRDIAAMLGMSVNRVHQLDSPTARIRVRDR